MLRFRCPSCKALLQTGESQGGAIVGCPNCKSQIKLLTVLGVPPSFSDVLPVSKATGPTLTQKPASYPVELRLRELLATQGQGLCAEIRRCESLVMDVCGEKTKEAHLLIQALKQQVPADLLGIAPEMAVSSMLARLGKRLEDRLGLAGASALWAVECWAVALGIVHIATVTSDLRAENGDVVEDNIEEDIFDNDDWDEDGEDVNSDDEDDEEFNFVLEDEDSEVLGAPPAFGSGVAAKINSIRQEHNAVQNGQTGLLMHVAFDVSGMKEETGHLAVYFADAAGTSLTDTDGRYCSQNGQVSTGGNFTPLYEATTWQDFRLFIPYNQLHLRNGQHNVTFSAEVFKSEVGGWRHLARSRDERFQIRWNMPVQQDT